MDLVKDMNGPLFWYALSAALSYAYLGLRKCEQRRHTNSFLYGRNFVRNRLE